MEHDTYEQDRLMEHDTYEQDNVDAILEQHVMDEVHVMLCYGKGVEVVAEAGH
jgi:hypothetical protein